MSSVGCVPNFLNPSGEIVWALGGRGLVHRLVNHTTKCTTCTTVMTANAAAPIQE
jgi:hypothetical protein